MPKSFGLGVDFGGTKVLASVVDIKKGKVVGSAKKRTNPDDSPDELVDRLFSTIDKAIDDASLSKKQTIEGIGVGIAGLVDAKNGMLRTAPNLSPATVDLPITAILEDRYDMPAKLLNDVQIAALGEASFGAGRSVSDFLCVFVGTGIGGAIVHDGELVQGSTGSAGEIGHIIVHADGRQCGCGGHGHLEAYASRTAMTKAIRGHLRLGQTSSITKIVPELADETNDAVVVKSGAFAEAVDKGDDLVTEAILEAGHFLGLGLASMINLLNPERIVLGGGAIEAVDLLFTTASKTIQRTALEMPLKSIEIVKAELGDDAGVIGAALHATRKSNT